MLNLQGVSLNVFLGVQNYWLASAETKAQWPFFVLKALPCVTSHVRHVGIMREKCILLNKGCSFRTKKNVAESFEKKKQGIIL